MNRKSPERRAAVHRIRRSARAAALAAVALCMSPGLSAIEFPTTPHSPGAKVADWVAALGINPEFKDGFTNDGTLQVNLIDAKEKTNILWPGEAQVLGVQLINSGKDAIAGKAKWVVVQFEMFTHEGSIFSYGARKIADVAEIPVDIAVSGNATLQLNVTPPVPQRFGVFAVLLEIEGRGRYPVASIARTFKPKFQKRRFYKLCLDIRDADVLRRIGGAPNRMGLSPRFNPDEEERYYQQKAAELKKYAEAGLPITLEFGHEAPQRGAHVPLGRARGGHYDAAGNRGGIWDIVWSPTVDDQFIAFVTRLLVEFGWPKGPVNAVKIWNEPWNGGSIAGWGADDERFRELTIALDKAVQAAKKEAGVEVLQGGADSSSNTFDKLFSDGTDRFMPMLDFLSIHYQGTNPNTNVRMFRERKGPDGKPAPVLVWDTESWAGNTEDRVASVLAAMYSFGQQRAVGVDSGRTAITGGNSPRRLQWPGGIGKDNRLKDLQDASRVRIYDAFGPAAAIGAFQHFVGERSFKEMLWRGLPFVMTFEAEPQGGRIDPEDGTVVVLGDMGFFDRDVVAFRTVRSIAEVQGKRELRRHLAGLPAGSPELQAGSDGKETLADRLRKAWPYQDCVMTIAADSERYLLHDFYGNVIPSKDGKIIVPLNERAYYLRGNGKAGSFAALIAAVKAARIDGYEPLEKKIHDMTAPIAQRPVIRMELRNILNRPVSGSLAVEVKGLQLEFPKQIEFAAHEMKTIEVTVVGGTENAENRYPLHLLFDGGDGGIAEHVEDMRVNFISRRTITVDGNLEDWKGAISQSIIVDEVATATVTEKAWRPYETFDEGLKKGFSTAYLAWDEQNFYFAAKIADTSQHPGTLRFATRDDDAFFYPQIVYNHTYPDPKATDFSARWNGFVQTDVDGEHTFRLVRNNGVRLWVGGKLIIDDWANRSGKGDINGVATLKAGERVAIRLEYVQLKGDGVTMLRWNKPGMAFWYFPTLPTERLFPEAAGVAQGLSAEFYANTDLAGEPTQRRIDAIIDYESWRGLPTEPTFGKGKLVREPLSWPDGVRRYTYWQEPILPCGNGHGDFDNVQIAFNVLPADAKPRLETLPGIFPDYIQTTSSDYEWALNKVAEAYGGGTEVYRLRRPDIPASKHFYPRNLKSPGDGAAPGAQLVVRYEDGWRITEAAIPWTEMPEAKARLDAGQTVMFSYRVNDDQGVGCMELSKRRSVAKRGPGFYAEWKEHWTNHLRFGAEAPGQGKE
jgi:hypothetical protein